MNNFGKFALAAALVGVTALAAVSPSEARDGRNTAAAIGFGAGALVGAAVASSANNGYYDAGYNEPRYGYRRGYAYQPGYAYEPSYGYETDYYAYEPAPVYAPRYTRGGRSQCGGSPGSANYRPCNNQ
ncbi:hypothetical protein [Undibacter mobilis]|uniref:hypothetical protein n=1 Tax=Undibacter mobilis TaxID=2292256 RepID=UPI001AECD41E|nr:hypothetical protein [Undibacter mobilis]